MGNKLYRCSGHGWILGCIRGNNRKSDIQRQTDKNRTWRKRDRNSWDIFVSDIRNLVEGKEIKVVFDNDPGFYWIGRASIKDFDRTREIGRFTIAIQKADPYKYNVADS